ncbi:hypothetical protein GQX73_g6922 [Xylaria multiplex]|uniref:Uncharacterized protein n=1 Tax=Xylaria multiplex TaxID=323545 RepID=A0A7C8IPW9_9PEZI|nr:hypothetical protein GQX73_g6922 [Xylaria multiplex]
MFHNNIKTIGHRLSLRLIVLATIVAGGLAAAIPAPAAVKDFSCLIRGQGQAEDYCSNIHDPNKDGPYTYGNNVPFPNVTSTFATLTITLTSTEAVTETDAVSSPSGFTLAPNATAITTSNGTFHAQTATDSCTLVLVSSSVDGQTNSMTSLHVSGSNKLQSSISSSTDTVKTSLPMTGCTGTPTSDDQYSSTQFPVVTTVPHITVTTTILYSGSGSEEYTSTETITETPLVTVTRGTTITLSSAPETPATMTVTVYISQLPTQTQAEETSVLVSAADITVSEVVTATVVATVSPVPTTKCTDESTMTESDYVVSTSSSHATTLTITVTPGSLTSSTDVSPEHTTVETSINMTTVTVSASTSVDTTCKTSSTGTSNKSSTPATSSVTTTHTPYPMSVLFTNSTMTVTVGTITVPANVTAETTKHSGSTHTHHFYSTGSITTPYPANPTVSISSGSKLGKKRPVKIFWGDTDGGCSNTCVILLVMIISLLL